MATASGAKVSWNVDDLYKVSVYKENPEHTNAQVVVECFETSRQNVEPKFEKRSGKLVVQFPVPSYRQTQSEEMLREQFRNLMTKFITHDNSFVTIPIDDLKTWTKSMFCETLLAEYLLCATLKEERRQNYPVELTFCMLKVHNFDEAVKVCKKIIVGTASKSIKSSVGRMQSPSVKVVTGSLDQIKADALACTVSSDMDLSRGAVSSALLKHGGKRLQRDLDDMSTDCLPYGEIFIVPGHGLECSVVFFGALFPFDKKFSKEYKTEDDYYKMSVHDFVQTCLNLAEERHLHSIAFPAVGAGILKYPVHIVANEMFKTVNNWTGVYVREVRFVIYPADKEALQEFQEAKRQYDRNRESASSMGRQSGPTSVKTSEFRINNPHGNSTRSKFECRFPIPEGYSAEFIQICCEDKLDKLKKGDCDISFSKDTLIVRCPPEVVDIAKDMMVQALNKMKKDFPSREILDLTQSGFKQSDVMRKLTEIRESLNVECVMNSMKTAVNIFGKMKHDVKAAKDSIVSLLLPPRNTTESNSLKVGEEMSDVSSQHKPHRISRQFSWSTHAKELQVFVTKEKITVKVYSADILSVPVDCIVNAANIGLKHGGGIARAIEKAAGKDLTKDGRDYLKKHGKLKVGEACSTSAGKMDYKCVIHAVGPCWSDYKPYTLSNVDRCETDLYNAVINSLAEADRKKMETIAVSSISSGIYGCPLDLCSVQYAKAVRDHSALSKSSLKEIHFVDTNMEMVKTMLTTFQSMIPGDKIPKSYNKLKYVISDSTASRRDFADKRTPRNTWTDEGQSVSKMPSKDNPHQSRHRPGGNTGLVVYPFYHTDHPPGHKKKEFSCCFGVGQNLHIYTADILSVMNIDMVVCGNIPSGKSEGKLNLAISHRGGMQYKASKTAAFKKDAVYGSVVICESGDMKNFKWVGHAILYLKADCKDEQDRKDKVNSVFMKIFQTLEDKKCHSLAIPLIGTGKGKGDPSFFAERFIDALLHFCSFNKTYQFRIHLINKEKEKTQIAVNAVKKAVQEARPFSVVTKKSKPHGIPPAQNAVTRPSASGRQPPIPKYNGGTAHQYSVREGGSGGREKRKGETRQHKDYNERGRYHNRSQSPGRRKVKKRHENEQHGNELGASQRDKDKIGKDSSKESRWDSSEKSKKHNSFEADQRSDSPSSSDSESDERSDIIQGKADNATKKLGNLKIFDETNSTPVPDSSGNVGKELSEESDGGVEEEVPEIESDDEEDKVDDAAEDGDDGDETCVICMDDITDPRELPCGHVFCTDCIEAQFTYKEVCPTCGKVCGIITGDQPDGRMDVVTNDRASCAGFEGCGRIEITYRFLDGVQGPNHPNPGTRYKGISRTAYLPNNRKGKEISAMLKVAFDRKLVFTIGRSRTTGADGVITWNDIHHKTDPKPGTQFGYPDPSYLDRVTEELEVKGVTVNDVPTLSAPRQRRR